MMYKRRRCNYQNVWGILQPCHVVMLIILMSTSNSVVEGFGTSAFSANVHILNKGMAVKKELKRSAALEAASFTTSTNFIAAGASRRIRSISTRLKSNSDSDAGDDDGSSSPYWFAKVKTSSSSSAEVSQALPKEDIPKEDTPIPLPQQEPQQEPLQDTPIPPPEQPQQPQQPQQSIRPEDMPKEDTPVAPPKQEPQQATPIPPPEEPQQPQQSVRPNSPFIHSKAADFGWTDNRQPATGSGFTEDTPTPPPQQQQPRQPQQPIRPNSPFRHSNAADYSWLDSAKPPTEATTSRQPPATGSGFNEDTPIPPPQQQQQSTRPSSSSSHSTAANSSWTDIATPIPKSTTSARQPAAGSGFMPIFGVVPEITTPAPYQGTKSPSKEGKRTKPKGASDQERDLSAVNFQTEAPPAPTPTFEEPAPPLPAVPPPTDDFSQGIVPSSSISTIKVQEIDDEDEEDDDNSVPPIILEYMSTDEYMQTIVFPFRVDPNVRPEERIGRENDAPMFTPSVKADIYKVLRSPNDPKAGAQAPSSGPPTTSSSGKKASSSSPFAAVLLAKLDEGTYAFCDRSLYDSMEQHKTSDDDDDSPSSAAAWDKLGLYTPLDDDQMLKAVACIGQTTPNALAITKAFEAYLSQKAWAWGDYQASAFSIEFLVAFGNELSTRLDINHRIRSQKLSREELLILSKPPFCNYVQQDTMRIFQNQGEEKKPQK
mmetsp:Transcript_23970/g.58586  ORF Transcript_23970/g.58586 Transcript_23970/m.58586 type:complete len:710 (+) Transcript_23970:85-2214(+)